MLAGMSVASAVMILLSKNIIRSVFLLVVVFIGVAGIYMITQAEFVAVTQILVYVGGILILLMFGIMLTNRMEGQELISGHKRLIPGVLVAGLLLWLLISLILSATESFQTGAGYAQENISTTKFIGFQLMTSHILALEITAVLLLVALVGAAFIVGHKDKVKAS